MGTGSIPKVMLSMGIPMILSMILQACYNIVDSMFVGRIPDSGGISGLSDYAINALTLAFPVQMLIVAFGIGTGVGVNALLAQNLGRNDKEAVAKTAGNGIFLGIVIYILFVIFGVLGLDVYLRAQTSDPIAYDLCKKYLNICVFLSIGIIMFSVFEKLLQSTGKSVYSTIAQIAGAVTNIVLDPIMIFGYFGCPAMGIEGAAWATVIGQFVSWIIAMIFHFFANKEVPAGIKYIKPDMKIIAGINIALQGVFQAVACGGSSLIVSLLRLCVITLPLAYAFTKTSNPDNMVWWAFPIAEAVTAVVTVILMARAKKKVIDRV